MGIKAFVIVKVVYDFIQITGKFPILSIFVPHGKSKF